MSRYRKVDPRIWNDKKFMELSGHAKLVFFFGLTHQHLTMLGAMRGTVPGLAAELGWGLEDFQESFQEVTSKGMFRHDPKASFFWLPNFMKYNAPESPNVVRSWPSAFQLLPECAMKSELLQRLQGYVQGLGEGFQKAFAEGFGKSMLNQEQEQEQEPEQDKGTPADPGESEAGASEPTVLEPVTEKNTNRPARQKPSESARAESPPCPHKAIIEVFHAVCSVLPKVQVWNGSNKEYLRTRWKEDPSRQNLEWWKAFFRDYVAASSFLTGKKTGWRASLDWLVKSANFDKVLNGQYMDNPNVKKRCNINEIPTRYEGDDPSSLLS